MTSLSKNARVAGLLYIVASVVGVVRLMYIPNALFVGGSAAATANNIVAHESLFRLGIVSQLLASVSSSAFSGSSFRWLFIDCLREMQQAVEHGADRGSITQQLAVPQFRYKSNLLEARVVIASLYLVLSCLPLPDSC